MVQAESKVYKSIISFSSYVVKEMLSHSATLVNFWVKLGSLESTHTA